MSVNTVYQTHGLSIVRCVQFIKNEMLIFAGLKAFFNLYKIYFFKSKELKCEKLNLIHKQ